MAGWRTPVVLLVMGSPAVRGALADPGWRRKARLTPGYDEAAALRLRTNASGLSCTTASQ